MSTTVVRSKSLLIVNDAYTVLSKQEANINLPVKLYCGTYYFEVATVLRSVVVAT